MREIKILNEKCIISIGKFWKGVIFNFSKYTVRIFYSLGNIEIDYANLGSEYSFRIIGLPKLRKRYIGFGDPLDMELPYGTKQESEEEK